MPVPNPGSHHIDLQDAAVMTRRFREGAGANAVIAGIFNADDIRKILDQTDCAGLRYYYGINDTGQPVIILTGTDSEGNDLYNGELAELASLCPTICSADNPLNSD